MELEVKRVSLSDCVLQWNVSLNISHVFLCRATHAHSRHFDPNQQWQDVHKLNSIHLHLSLAEMSPKWWVCARHTDRRWLRSAFSTENASHTVTEHFIRWSNRTRLFLQHLGCFSACWFYFILLGFDLRAVWKDLTWIAQGTDQIFPLSTVSRVMSEL